MENLPLPKKLPMSLYRQSTKIVARRLLGQRLVHVIDGVRLSGTIVETEAYLGLTDRACHTFGGRRTPRTEPMYLEGGHAYIYFIYGMHYCFNVVTRTTRHPEAVLIRALEPDEGIPLMYKNRKLSRQRHKAVNLANGPAKLCQALALDKSLNGAPLNGSEIFIEFAAQQSGRNVIARPRIGIDYAKEARDWPLRFYLGGNPYVSKPQQ